MATYTAAADGFISDGRTFGAAMTAPKVFVAVDVLACSTFTVFVDQATTVNTVTQGAGGLVKMAPGGSLVTSNSGGQFTIQHIGQVMNTTTQGSTAASAGITPAATYVTLTP